MLPALLHNLFTEPPPCRPHAFQADPARNRAASAHSRPVLQAGEQQALPRPSPASVQVHLLQHIPCMTGSRRMPVLVPISMEVTQCTKISRFLFFLIRIYRLFEARIPAVSILFDLVKSLT
jgi:hypothetical protein